jgi:hypothetical protein
MGDSLLRFPEGNRFYTLAMAKRSVVDDGQDIVFFHLVACLCFEGTDGPAAGGEYRRFHFHGFDDQHFVIFLYSLAHFEVHLDDFARQGG